jgi:hypothetical protein
MNVGRATRYASSAARGKATAKMNQTADLRPNRPVAPFLRRIRFASRRKATTTTTDPASTKMMLLVVMKRSICAKIPSSAASTIITTRPPGVPGPRDPVASKEGSAVIACSVPGVVLRARRQYLEPLPTQLGVMVALCLPRQYSLPESYPPARTSSRPAAPRKNVSQRGVHTRILQKRPRRTPNVTIARPEGLAIVTKLCLFVGGGWQL